MSWVKNEWWFRKVRSHSRSLYSIVVSVRRFVVAEFNRLLKRVWSRELHPTHLRTSRDLNSPSECETVLHTKPSSSKSGEYSENISWLLPLLSLPSNSTFFHMLRRESEIWMVLVLLCGWHIRWGTFMISFDVLIRFGCLLDRLSAEQLKRGRKGSRSLNWKKWENWFGSPRGKLKDLTLRFSRSFWCRRTKINKNKVP